MSLKHAVSCTAIGLGLAAWSGGGPRTAPVYYSSPAWSPDGQTIAFESNREGEAAVYTIRRDGSGLTRLTPAGELGEQPNWRPDGRRIVYASTRDGATLLCLMTPEGTERTPLANTANGFLPAFSADGAWLLFAAQERRPSSQYQVIVMHPDGSSRHVLGDTTKSNEGPAWSGDGRRVLFTEVPLLERGPNEAPRDFIRRRNGAARMLSVAPDGSDSRAVDPTDAERMTRDRELSPDGRWQVVVKEVRGVSGLYLREVAVGVERLLDAGPRSR
ncbi:MAG: TolB family protein [Gemmatimonadales bacterium]